MTIPGRRRLDVKHAEGQATSDREGLLLPLHRQEQFHQHGPTGDTPWHQAQANISGATWRGSAM